VANIVVDYATIGQRYGRMCERRTACPCHDTASRIHGRCPARGCSGGSPRRAIIGQRTRRPPGHRAARTVTGSRPSPSAPCPPAGPAGAS
jgi:hypothetical protein